MFLCRNLRVCRRNRYVELFGVLFLSDLCLKKRGRASLVQGSWSWWLPRLVVPVGDVRVNNVVNKEWVGDNVISVGRSVL